jgi:hypothetical protein
MGYLGSNLEDYYGYQLIDEVIRQLKNGDPDPHMKQLKAKMKILQKLIEKQDK